MNCYVNIIEPLMDNILLIDDDCDTFLELLSPIAEVFGFNVVGEKSVKSGVTRFRENQEEFQAILLDLSFSPENYEGVRCLDDLKAINPLIPVIILSGTAAAKDLAMAVHCMKNGALNYMSKQGIEADALFGMLATGVNQYKKKKEEARRRDLQSEYVSRSSAYEKMRRTTETIVSDMLDEKVMFRPTIETRVKEFDSFYNKLLIKEEKEGRIIDPFKRIVDVVGVRVIFYNSKDLELATSLLQQSDDFLPLSGTNKLAGDDKTTTHGYRAIHFDVQLNPEKRLHLKEYQGIENTPAEIQFKTIFAHSWSKVHHALSYKSNEAGGLNELAQEKLNEDFRIAAEKLVEVEKQITNLCQEYHDSQN